MKQLAGTCLMLLMGLICQAQNDFRAGYIINLKGEKELGDIHYRGNKNNYKTCVFKKNGVEFELDHTQIKAFGINGNKRYSSGIAEDSFVEVLVEGEAMSLYRGPGSYYLLKDTAIIHLTVGAHRTKEVEGLYIPLRTSDTRWKGVLVSQMQDCLSFEDQEIENLRFSEKVLTKQVLRYNACRNTASTEIKEAVSALQLHAELMSGLSISAINAAEVSFFDNDWAGERNASSLFLGVNLIFVPSKKNDHLAFVTGFTFNRSTYLRSNLVDQPDIIISSLTVPIAARFSEDIGELDIFVQTGTHVEFHRDTSLKNYVSATPLLFGVHLMTGFSKAFNGKHVGFVFGASTTPLDAMVIREVKIARFYLGLNFRLNLLPSTQEN